MKINGKQKNIWRILFYLILYRIKNIQNLKIIRKNYVNDGIIFIKTTKRSFRFKRY